MRKSEYARSTVKQYLADRGEPTTIRHLIDKAWMFTDDGDPRWIGVALMNLVKDGEVRYVDYYYDDEGHEHRRACDDNHNHDDYCAVELIKR